jgi:hypothetical protein
MNVSPPPAARGTQFMLNRSAVAVRPKQPFLDWVNSVEADSSVTLDDLQKTLYLVPDYEDPEDAEKVLKRVYDDIFCRELQGWYTLESLWPQDRSLRIFKQWFEIEHFDLIEDVGHGPIENDE